PDIFLNPHGYPWHEWVQLFSEYAAWVRTRAVETRDYWTMRGLWIPGVAWLDDPRYPRHKDEQMKLLTMITEYASASADTVGRNGRMGRARRLWRQVARSAGQAGGAVRAGVMIRLRLIRGTCHSRPACATHAQRYEVRRQRIVGRVLDPPRWRSHALDHVGE